MVEHIEAAMWIERFSSEVFFLLADSSNAVNVYNDGLAIFRNLNDIPPEIAARIYLGHSVFLPPRDAK